MNEIRLIIIHSALIISYEFIHDIISVFGEVFFEHQLCIMYMRFSIVFAEVEY